jgi:hypothetical protein
MKKLLIGALCFIASFSVAQVTVQVSAPTASSTVSTPIHVHATASSSHLITGWHIYLDGTSVYAGPAVATIDTNVNASQGSHQIVIRAWDSTGAYGSQTLQATASSTAGTAPAPTPVPATPSSPTGALPTPPSTARVYSNVEQMTTGWAACNTAACAGGNGGGAYWQAFNQTTPSLDGRSMEIYHDGGWSNALWYRKMGADNSASNFLWDFYVQLDSASVNASQALEYDAFQFVGGYNYMIGTECNYAAGVWDTWNEVTQHWLHTTVPCKKFAAGTWHHIQWYMTANHSNHTYTYKTLVVDGVVYNLNQTQPAKNLGWGDNAGVQWQLDVNASGAGYHEWVDRATFTMW